MSSVVIDMVLGISKWSSLGKLKDGVDSIEKQNESFKYSYLQRHKNSLITGMLLILIEEFLLDKYESYLHFLSIFENHLWHK